MDAHADQLHARVELVERESTAVEREHTTAGPSKDAVCRPAFNHLSDDIGRTPVIPLAARPEWQIISVTGLERMSDIPGRWSLIHTLIAKCVRLNGSGVGELVS